MDKYFYRIPFIVMNIFIGHIASAQPFPLSDGLYRLPYENGTGVRSGGDVWTHDPVGCIDIWGISKITKDYLVVAAAGGWIRAIRDFNTRECHSSLPAPNNFCCNEFNNFIVLEHPNGEWSTYIHLANKSITALGHKKDDWVDVGTVLGIEGSVGCSSGPHVHLEIARPNTGVAQPWSSHDGVLRRTGQLVNPVFCGASGGFISSANNYTASPCNAPCTANMSLISLPTGAKSIVNRAGNSISSKVAFIPSVPGMYRAGTEITLTPGFEAPAGTEFTAQIKGCNEQ